MRNGFRVISVVSLERAILKTKYPVSFSLLVVLSKVNSTEGTLFHVLSLVLSKSNSFLTFLVVSLTA